MANRCVAFYTENAAIVDIINKQTYKHQLVMILVRDMVLTSLKHNILFRARHIPGVLNTGADYISRFQVEQFKQISPKADEMPTSLPANLLPLFHRAHDKFIREHGLFLMSFIENFTIQLILFYL